MRNRFPKAALGLKWVRDRLCVDKMRHPQAYAYSFPQAQRQAGYW